MKKGKYLKKHPKQSRPNPGLNPVPAPKHKQPQKLTKAQRATKRFLQRAAQMLLAMLVAMLIGCAHLAHPALIGLIVIGLLVDLAISYARYEGRK